MGPVRPILILACVAICGCDSWPLHAALPDPSRDLNETPTTSEIAEDTELAEGDLQDLGTFSEWTELSIAGFTESCGWDSGQTWPEWPSHPVDDDGDGEIDRTEPRTAGWYSGDVDWFGVRLNRNGTAHATLRWENPPADGTNVPYQPGVPGPWELESDLDVLAFSVEGGEPSTVLAEAGFSVEHPEDLGAPMLLEADRDVAFAVGCHHEVPIGYTLTLSLRPETQAR